MRHVGMFLLVVLLALTLPAMVMGEPAPTKDAEKAVVEEASQKENSVAGTPVASGPMKVNLEECLKIALDKNQYRPASKFAVDAAQAQLRQVQAGYMPQFVWKAAWTRMDQGMNFVFPAETSVSELLYTVPPPAVLGGPPPGTQFWVPNTVRVPEKNVKLMDEKSLVNSLGMTFPLYTGGQLEGLAGQARAGLDAARQEQRKTDLQVVRDTKRAYFTCIMARNLKQIAQDTLDRMELTLELTERLYKSGSTKVKKTDYLRNKLTVEAIRSSLATMEGLEKTARAALVNTIGLDWNTQIEVADQEIPCQSGQAPIDAMVATSYQFNPDWAKVEAGLRALENKIKESKSGNLPKVALTGSLNAIENGYDKGVMTPRNKHNWNIALGMEFPLFDGNLTTQKVREARARLKKLQSEKILLREGIALQVQHLCNGFNSGLKQVAALRDAAKSAEENRDLNIRAYQNELVETKDVIEAQITEAMMKVGLEKALYDQVDARATLDSVVGTEVAAFIQEVAPVENSSTPAKDK